MNRNETKLLVENWRKVLNEGLHDSDSELLLTEGFLQDLSDQIGSKLTTGIQTLGLLAALKGSAYGLPNEKIYQDLKNKVIYQTVASYGITDEKTIEKIIEKFDSKFDAIAEDEILAALDQLHSTAMSNFDFDTVTKIEKIIKNEIKPLIKTKTIKDTNGNEIEKNYIDKDDFNKLARKHPGLFKLSARVAKDVLRLTDPLNPGGANKIKNTDYNKKN
jgi:hypothetical protein